MQGKADVCCVLCAAGEVLGRALPTWVPQEWCWEWAGRKPLLSLGFNGCCCCLRGRKGISSWFHPSFCLVNNQNLQKKGKRGEVSLNLTLNSKFKYFNSLVRARLYSSQGSQQSQLYLSLGTHSSRCIWAQHAVPPSSTWTVDSLSSFPT